MYTFLNKFSHPLADLWRVPLLVLGLLLFIIWTCNRGGPPLPPASQAVTGSSDRQYEMPFVNLYDELNGVR